MTEPTSTAAASLLAATASLPIITAFGIPLGLRADAANAAYCHQKRTAWLLNDLAPATFSDRLRSGDPRISYFVDPKSGKRVLPECAKRPPTRIETARWPAVLEPWLDGDVRSKALPPEWDAACASSQRQEAEIRIAGLTDGAILRKAGNQDVLLIKLDVRGTQGEVIWMVNGRVLVRSKASVGLVHAIREPGRYDVTLLDDHGHYDRISFSVR